MRGEEQVKREPQHTRNQPEGPGEARPLELGGGHGGLDLLRGTILIRLQHLKGKRAL